MLKHLRKNIQRGENCPYRFARFTANRARSGRSRQILFVFDQKKSRTGNNLVQIFPYKGNMSESAINSILLGAILLVGAYFFFTSGPNAVTAAGTAHFFGFGF